MNRARHDAATIGRILLFTSLMAVVLVLALWISGPVLVVAIFTAVVLLVPLATAPRSPATVFVGVRRRRFLSRAPPTF
jgi:type IV secretory pathway TrbD component